MRRIAVCLLLVIAVVITGSCSPGEPSEAENAENSLNLVSLFPVAEQFEESSQIPLRFNSRRAALQAGLTPLQRDADRNRYVAMIEQEARFEVVFLRAAARQLNFEAAAMGPLGGSSSQHVDLLLNGTEIGNWDLAGAEWQNIAVELPEDVQNIGNNTLTFRCESLAKNSDYSTDGKGAEFPQVGAYLRNLSLGGNNADPSFQLSENHEALRQIPDSAFSYGFKPTKNALLSLSATTFAQSPQGTISVFVETRSDSDVSWSTRLSREFTFESESSSETLNEEIDLADTENQPLEIRIRVTGEGAYVVWNQLQLDMDASEESHHEKVAAEVKAPRHAIVIVADASNPRFYGCYGDNEGLTPNIDAFASDAMLFENAVAPGAQTAKTVSTIFSGMLPDFHGVFGVETAFPEHLPTLPGAFRESGFQTMVFAGIKVVSSNFDLSRDFHKVVDLRRPEYIRDETSEMDMEALKSALASAAESGERLFLYMHILPPHWPYNPPESFMGGDEQAVDTSYKNRIKRMLRFGGDNAVGEDIEVLKYMYRKNLRYADHVVGEILEQLRELGLYDESLIILTADHGEAFGEHGDILHGKTVYDEMIHVPFIARLPEGKRGIQQQQIGLVDLFPTFKSLFGLKSEAKNLHGRNISPLLMGEEQKPRDYYFSRTGSDKIVIFSLRGDRYKLVQHLGQTELFDLLEDPFETTNLAERYPALSAYLRTRGRMIVEAGRAYRTFESRDAELDDEDVKELKDLGYLQ